MLAVLAVELEVDVVLIAGDLFDHQRVKEPHVAEAFGVLGALAATGVDCVVLCGNHDAHDEGSLYRRFGDHVERSGVQFLDDPDGRMVDLADGRLSLWSRALTDHSPTNRPLDGAPPHPGGGWYVVGGHGHFIDDPLYDSHRSSRITVDDINAPGADYVALGHWHVTTDLRPRGATTQAWYPGSPLFGYGSQNMLLVDFDPAAGVAVTPIDVLARDRGCA